jgi:hypothetical protein
MRLCLIICALALAACGRDVVVPPDMLTPCTGWQGGTPKTEGDLLRAGAAERAGRICANTKLEAVRAVLGGA